MSIQLYDAIQECDLYKEMITKKKRYALWMSFILLQAYYSLILIIAFAPQWLSIPILPGRVMTTGALLPMGLIFLSWGLTGIYARKANREYDTLNQQVLEKAQALVEQKEKEEANVT